MNRLIILVVFFIVNTVAHIHLDRNFTTKLTALERANNFFGALEDICKSGPSTCIAPLIDDIFERVEPGKDNLNKNTFLEYLKTNQTFKFSDVKFEKNKAISKFNEVRIPIAKASDDHEDYIILIANEKAKGGETLALWLEY